MYCSSGFSAHVRNLMEGTTRNEIQRNCALGDIDIPIRLHFINYRYTCAIA